MTATATASTLSSLMREGSQAEHTAAETSTFMARLLAGEVNRLGYLHYLEMLRPVYEALERDRFGADPIVAAVADPGLHRLAAIDADLAHWSAAGESLGQPDVVSAYVARIEAAGPLEFVAHHYTRYLGDLSGGQAIGRILDRSFGLGGEGLAFYAFPEIGKPKPYKDGYRSRLDGLGLSPVEQRQVVAEVRTAFRLNSAVFADLSTRLGQYARPLAG